jgi:ABC-2 type transport system permease protein
VRRGTLERLLASPLRRGELVAGYVLGLSFFAIVQTAVVIAFSIWVLNVRYRGNLGTIFLVELVMVLGAVNLGLFLSTFARNEFQAVQFIPLVVLPQAFLSGIFIRIQDLPDLLRPLAYALPLTYANEALRAVMVKGFGLTDPIVVRDLAALLAFAALAAIAATATIRREVA